MHANLSSSFRNCEMMQIEGNWPKERALSDRVKASTMQSLRLADPWAANDWKGNDSRALVKLDNHEGADSN